MWMKFLPEKPINPATALTPGGTHAFEHRWAMNEAFDFHLAIGKARVSSRIHDLNRQLKLGLANIKGVHLHTPVDQRLTSGIVAFEVDKVGPMDTVSTFKKHRIIATQAPYNPSYARLAPGLINTAEEVEYCVQTIAELAAS